MFMKKNEEPQVTKGTVIAEGMVLEGCSLVGEGDVSLSGKLVGGVDIDGDLTVEKTAKIVGNVTAQEVEVLGEVRGDIVADSIRVFADGKIYGNIVADSIRLFADGKVYGDIVSESIVLDVGSEFKGVCSIGDCVNQEEFEDDGCREPLSCHSDVYPQIKTNDTHRDYLIEKIHLEGGDEGRPQPVMMIEPDDGTEVGA